MKKLFGIFTVLVISYFSISPLFGPGFFPMHDDTQPSRVFEMAKSLKDGQFPVRWVADLGYGYGYPIFNFYAPLAYYFGALFAITGLNILIATKIMMGFGMVIAGVSMYLLAREFWGEYGGILSGIFYVYAPYHAVNLYVRGDVAEFWAYAFVPLVFLGIYKIFSVSIYLHGNNSESSLNDEVAGKEFLFSERTLWQWVAITGMSYAAVILSHNLTAMMITPFLFAIIIILSVFSYFKYNTFRVPFYIKLAIIVGIFLSAFYWLPVLTEMHHTNVLSQVGGKADYRLHFVCPIQLWESQWGFGGSTPNCVDGMSYRIGKLHVLLSITAFLLIPVLWFRSKKKEFFTVSSVFVLLLSSAWLTTPYARFVWDILPFMSFFQYPWRFLLVITGLSSFLAGSIMWIIPMLFPSKRIAHVATVVSLVVLFLGVYLLYGKLFRPQTINAKTERDYISEDALKWHISKISDEYLPKEFSKPESQSEVVRDTFMIHDDEDGTVETVEQKTGYSKGIADVAKQSDIRVRIAPFPAWKFFLNDKELQPKSDKGGYVLTVPKGKHTIIAVYSQTLFQLIGNLLSLTGIVGIIIGIMKTRLSNQSDA